MTAHDCVVCCAGEMGGASEGDAGAVPVMRPAVE